MKQTPIDNEQIRLNKYLSESGICSRREADSYIASGKVTVNGKLAVMGMKISNKDSVAVNGKTIIIKKSLVLLAVNKPRGIVCTTKNDPDNIIDFLNYPERIYPIGRLDKDSEGLILLTNQGDLVNKINKSGNFHEKEYLVTVNRPVTEEFIQKMQRGVPILDTVTRSCTVNSLKDKNSFTIILTQGLNRQIRRMCEALGYKVITLKRVRIMNIRLGRLKTGGYRKVTDRELEGLYKTIQESKNQTYKV